MLPRMPPTKFQLNQTYGLGEMSLEELQEGCFGSHLGYQNLMILAITIKDNHYFKLKQFASVDKLKNWCFYSR